MNTYIWIYDSLDRMVIVKAERTDWGFNLTFGDGSEYEVKENWLKIQRIQDASEDEIIKFNQGGFACSSTSACVAND